LELCRHWAEGRVATGNEPPWAWYQYMKLIETVSAIQTSRAAVSTVGGARSPSANGRRLRTRRGTRLQTSARSGAVESPTTTTGSRRCRCDLAAFEGDFSVQLESRA